MALRTILYRSPTSAKWISLLFKNGIVRLTPMEHSARYSCLLRKNLFLTTNTVTLNRQINVDSEGQSDGERKTIKMGKQLKKGDKLLYVILDGQSDGERKTTQMGKQLKKGDKLLYVILDGQSDGERKTTQMEKQLKKEDGEGQTESQRLNGIEVKLKECTSLASALKMLKQNSRILRNNYGSKEKDEPMGRMAKFLQELHHGKEMTSEDFKMFMHVKPDVRIFHYHDDEFCEKLQDFVLNKNTEYSVGGIAKVLNHCYLLNHACNPKIISLFREVFEKNVNSMNLNQKIFNLGTLCKMNVYPEEHITALFSSENHAKIANLQKEYDAVRAVFNVLNRSIILNCPHLKIPFIGLTREYQTMPVLMEDLKKSLDNVLGDGFYKSNTILPYNIHLGVEAFLTSDGKAVAYEVGKKMKDLSLQGLGILLSSRRSFCLLSDNEPLGNVHTIIKHIQKLNYKAILVLEKEWETLKTDKDKNNYLRGKIFSK